MFAQWSHLSNIRMAKSIGANHENIMDEIDYSNSSMSANGAPIIWVTDYGGDPSGKTDSTSALKQAINVALTMGAPNANLSNGIHDCGGATIHLGGGDYLISSPLIIPENYGNLRIIDGTIRAANNFSPVDAYLSRNINYGNLHIINTS